MDRLPQVTQYDPVAPQDEVLPGILPLAYLAIREIERGSWDRYLSRISAAIRTRVIDETAPVEYQVAFRCLQCEQPPS